MCNLPYTLKLFESNKACFFLYSSNVLGMCRGMHMRLYASYAEACFNPVNYGHIIKKI